MAGTLNAREKVNKCSKIKVLEATGRKNFKTRRCCCFVYGRRISELCVLFIDISASFRGSDTGPRLVPTQRVLFLTQRFWCCAVVLLYKNIVDRRSEVVNLISHQGQQKQHT